MTNYNTHFLATCQLRGRLKFNIASRQSNKGIETKPLGPNIHNKR
jgi:hypothetical protein